MTEPFLRIDWASYKSAKYACERWHYAKCLPVGKLVKVGAWEAGEFVGVVVFGRGAAPHLGRRYNLNQTECVELVRVALTDHKTPVSKIIAIAIRFLRRRCQSLKLIVSFADECEGHHGGVYQAGNWIYTGQSDPAHFYLIKGKKTHPRSVGAKGLEQSLFGARHLDPCAKKILVPGKHRYLMPLTKETWAKIVPLALPYPKRKKLGDGFVQKHSGGAAPTLTLQTLVKA